jgi:hypothetical protein
MPNWCENTLTIRGNKNLIAKIKETVINESGDFDFAKVIPPPDHPHYNAAPLGPSNSEIWASEYNWYNWNTFNWGTKWNANDTSVSLADDGQVLSIFFATAWSPPEPVTYALKDMFPKAKVRHAYREDGMGFKGVIEL